MSEVDKNATPHQKLYLCVHRFVQVPVSMVYSCSRGAPKVWKLYPVVKESELRNCKFVSHTYSILKISLNVGATPCCQEDCCEGQGWDQLDPLLDQSTTTTQKPHGHTHLYRDISALELASVWVATLLLFFGLILLSKKIYRSVRTPAILKRLRSYAEGPYASTEQTEEGTIVPAVHYFEAEKAKEMFRNKSKQKTKKQKEREKRMKRRERQSVNAIAPEEEHLDSMMFLEMQMFQMDEDDYKIIPEEENKSNEEIIIDAILTIPIDTLMQHKNVPDKLLSSPKVQRQSSRRMSGDSVYQRMSLAASSRRGSAIDPQQDPNGSRSIPLPTPLYPSYLPTKPVVGILNPNHNTERMYRYATMERIVYPHERVIVPAGFVL